METTIHLIVAFLVFVTAGLVKRLVLISIVRQKLDFLNRYSSIFDEFMETYPANFDSLLYLWLTNKVSEVQQLLSYFSVDNKIPLIKPVIKNPQLIARTLPAMKNGTANRRNVSSSYNALLCCKKSMEELMESLHSDLRKPFKLSLSGILYFVSLPVLIMFWLNLISESMFYRIINSYELRLANLITCMICLIMSSIVVGNWCSVP
ncbi:MAG: hypothetical protein PWQ44_1481 [Methanolobus sp.]|nr:hypothetical protein [Methanolobus sp.]